MNDERVWSFEQSLWQAGGERYHDRVDAECVMVLGHSPYLFAGPDAAEAVSGTPEWENVTFTRKTVHRPQEGLIVLGYDVRAEKDGTSFSATCSSVYRRCDHDDWTVIQHSQLSHDL